MKQIEAAVIVVTFNHVAYIGDCLRSLALLDPAPSEVVVVDNASRDGTAALIKAEFPTVRLIEAGANLGFAGGCNLGVRATTAAIVVLANPDLVVQPTWLGELVAPLNRWASIGVTGSKLLYRDGQTVQHAGGNLRLPLALGDHRGVGTRDDGRFNAVQSVDYVTGAALATRRNLWDALHGMDEQFFPAYYEEVDYCTRVRQAGYSVVYTPRAVASHVEGTSIGQGSARYLRLFHFNRLRYLFKHFNNIWLMRTWLPAELAHIRAVARDEEVEALQTVYLAFQSAFCNHEDKPVISDLDVFPDATADGGETELQWVERQLAAKTTIMPTPLRSRWPLVARLRNSVLRLATADYIAPIVQAQNDTNRATAEAIRALVRQRRAADAAVLLQGMLLAKVNG